VDVNPTFASTLAVAGRCSPTKKKKTAGGLINMLRLIKTSQRHFFGAIPSSMIAFVDHSWPPLMQGVRRPFWIRKRLVCRSQSCMDVPFQNHIGPAGDRDQRKLPGVKKVRTVATPTAAT